MKGTPMQTKIAQRFPVRGRLRALMRLPIWLYRLRFGWLLGERGLMLTHIGRKSGRLRRTVLEVGGYDPTTDTYTIGAGWGEQSDWVRNIQQRPDVLVDVGRRRFEATAWRLPAAEAEGWFRDFARRRPFEFRTLVRMATGQGPTRTDDDYRTLARAVPVVALRPRQPSS
jgi:deazaflavin-dependent oxidoreductase (nitroreductase family)